jgi:predicted small secreted protein
MMMTKILAASLLVAFALTGCNTFKGVGKDVSKAGDAVTNTAERTSDEIRRN